MAKISLPELKINYFNKVDSKNKVEQLIVEEIYVDYFFRESHKGYAVILVDGRFYKSENRA